MPLYSCSSRLTRLAQQAQLCRAHVQDLHFHELVLQVDTRQIVSWDYQRGWLRPLTMLRIVCIYCSSCLTWHRR